MHLLTFPAPKSDPNTIVFASSSRFLPHCSTNYGCIKRVSQSKYGSEFCNWPKRVSKSPFFLRNHGRSVGVQCEVSAVKDDTFYMRRCVEIAKKALGCTSPNPMVGCVIVKDGKIVGEGFHPKAGQPHAEVFALKDAGILAENATAYVSLEPCNHYGRTPPCTEALIRAKVKHVVIGMVDPNPIVASKGVEKLRASGIEVKSGVEEELCRKLNEAYIHRMLTGRPLVTLRYSLSFNGQIVNQLGEGAEESGGYYSKLLQAYDGVIISGPSVAKISNYPKSQEIGAHQPLQIIVATVSDSPLRLPALTLATPAIVFKHKDAVIDPTTESELHNQLGVEIVVLDQLNLSPILDYCWQRGLCNVLIDLRGEFAGFDEIIENGLVEGLLQKVVVEVLPFWVRSEDSHVMRLKSLGRDLVRLKNLESRNSKESVVVEGYTC